LRGGLSRVLSSLVVLPLIGLVSAAGCGGDSTTPGTGGNGGGVNVPPPSLCIDTAPMKIVPPAGLQVRFRALDCDGNPVRKLVPTDVVLLNDEKGVPFGKGGEGDSVSDVGEDSNIELYSVLVLDLSNSIHAAGALDAVIDGARAFVDETVTKPQARLKHRVAIIAFGRPDQITLEQDFTQSDSVLNAKLEQLRLAPPRGTTDLYDAYMLALAKVADVGTGGDAVVERFVVLLTDGTHEAGNEATLRAQALAAKHASSATVFAIGIEGNYDACRLEELAGRPTSSSTLGCREESACLAGTLKPATCTQFLPSVSKSALSTAFQDVASRAAGLARSNYVAGICTPVTLGSPTLTLQVAVDGVKDQATLPYDVKSLNGDVNSCVADEIQKGKLACDPFGVCEIVCRKMECGTDLGASCGTCGEKQVCSEAQQCKDACAGKNCGTDQGVECGACAGQEYCDAGVCKAPCAGKQCGTDQGVDCGTCAQGSWCDASGQCGACSGAVSFAAPVSYAAGPTLSAIATADLDGDGTLDLIAAGSGSFVSVLLNQGNGTFSPKIDYAAGFANVRSLVAADLDGDGKRDIVVSYYGGAVGVLLNNGNGTFAMSVTYFTSPGAFSVAVADLNGDGAADLAVANAGDTRVSVLLNKGNGTFAVAVKYTVAANPNSIAAADLDGDGKPDLAVASSNTGTVSVLHNQGNGVFAAKVDYPANSTLSGSSLVAADLNGDGRPDLALAYDGGVVSVLLNQGNGTFAAKVDYLTGAGVTSIAAADLNGDGELDLAVANANASIVSVLVNQGNGTFAAKIDFDAGLEPGSVVAADLNGDGRPDLAVASSGTPAVNVMLGKCVP
jgi:uncharacterized protein YegL